MKIRVLYIILIILLSAGCGELSITFLNSDFSEESPKEASFKPFELQQYLRLPNAEVSNTFERFGSRVVFARSVRRLFVGAGTDSHSAKTEAGSIYVYDFNSSTESWTLTGIIRKPAAINYDNTGQNITTSADGKTILTAGQYSDGLMVFKENPSTPGDWQLVQTIRVTGDRTGTLRYFGQGATLCRDESTLIFSGPSLDDSITGQGAVFVYKLNTNTQLFEQHQKIVELDALNSIRQLGLSLSTDRNCENLVLSSHRETIDYANQGRVYVYHLNSASGNFEKMQVLSTSATYANLYFGTRVRLAPDASMLAITTLKIVNSYAEGSIMLYSRNASGEYVYSETLDAPQEVVNPSGNTNWAADLMFTSDGKYLYSSIPSCYNGITITGCLDLLKKENGSWTLKQRISSDIVGAQSFGSNIVLSEDREFLAVGVPSHTIRKSGNGTAYSGSGSVFVYRVSELAEVDVQQEVPPNKYLKERSSDLQFFSDMSATGTAYQKVDITDLIFNNTSHTTVSGWSVLAMPQTGSVLLESNKFQQSFTLGFSYMPQALTNNMILLSNEKIEVKLVNSSQLQLTLYSVDGSNVTSSLTWITDPGVIALSRWNHVMFSISFGGLADAPKLYLNGDQLFLYNIASQAPDLSTLPAHIMLGDRLSTNTLAGNIKNVLVWRGSISASEANKLKPFYKAY